MTAETQPIRVRGWAANTPRSKASMTREPSLTAFSSRFTQCRIGFWERNVKPRAILASSGGKSIARSGVPSDSAASSLASTSCSRASTSVRRLRSEVSSRSRRRSTTSRSARTSSVSTSAIWARGSGGPSTGSGKPRTTCSRASAFRNSLASSPARSPSAIPARSTTSNVAYVVFCGEKTALSRSTRGSGTRAMPVRSSARPASKRAVAALAPVSKLNSVVLPVLGRPMRPIFIQRL